MKPRKHYPKGDVLLRGRVTREELAIDFAQAPFDALRREMDRKWGTGRLVSRVTPATAAKYGRTLGRLREAADALDLDAVVERVAGCIRGLQAMDAEALALGNEPPDPGVRVVETPSGFRFGILLNDRCWMRGQEDHPGLVLYSLPEVGTMIENLVSHPQLAAIKDAFPGAVVAAIRPRTPKGDMDDPLPAF